MLVRTRFAPSPTGYLHLGGARTALFAWAYARHHGGQFILRIEDTDRVRSTQTSIDAILQGMAWLNLEYDEGPFFQTERLARYHTVIAELLDSGHAYRCICSKERLAALREQQIIGKQKPRYDGLCRQAQWGDDVGEHVIRFKNPEQGTVTFDDAVHGVITVANEQLDDLVIARSDGSPTYNLTVVVDDADMQITDVIRGDDHINNTPRQINLLHALGLTVPRYAHVPMILGEDGRRLSKRHGAVSVMAFRDAGYTPEAFLNYLIRLGWSHGDQEIFSREQMIDLFNLEAVNKAPASINPDKLMWLNQHYLKTLSPEIIEPELATQLRVLGIDNLDDVNLTDIIAMQRERCKTVVEMADKSRYFFEAPIEYDAKAAAKHLCPEFKTALQQVLTDYQAMTTWQVVEIHQVILDVAAVFELKLGKLAQALRVAMTGGTVSPPLDVTLAALGQTEVVTRLQRALTWIATQVVDS